MKRELCMVLVLLLAITGVASVVKAQEDYIPYEEQIKKIEYFGLLNVRLAGSAIDLLDRESLQQYLELRFRNTFADIDYKNIYSYDKEKVITKDGDFLLPAEEIGLIFIDVKSMRKEYPIACYIEIRFGPVSEYEFLFHPEKEENYLMFTEGGAIYSNDLLGVQHRESLEEGVKNGINQLLEDFAHHFFKERGEL